MLENPTELGDIDLNQKRVRLDEVKGRKARFISNVIVYCGWYFPVSQHFGQEVLREIGDQHIEDLYEALRHLFGCVEREVITGPSSAHLPPGELPPTAKNDSLMTLHTCED
jgi:hypothetical protein